MGARLITCEFASKFSTNDAYLMFHNFPGEIPTKVTIFKKLTDDTDSLLEGWNPLDENEKKYEYIGEIEKR